MSQLPHSFALTRRHFALALLASPALIRPALAAPRSYTLDTRASTITFAFELNGIQQKGTAPISTAKLRVDPDNLVASTADVSADISRARTGLVFATDALKSESVLHTAQHPTARFRSTRIILGRGGRISDGAAIEGKLTLRGVTRTIRLDASLFRKAGSAADDLSQLEVRLRGRISRAKFGAVGYPKLVADAVGLDIRAQIHATG